MFLISIILAVITSKFIFNNHYYRFVLKASIKWLIIECKWRSTRILIWNDMLFYAIDFYYYPYSISHDEFELTLILMQKREVK